MHYNKMKRKILGIFVCILMVAAAILAQGTINKNIDQDLEFKPNAPGFEITRIIPNDPYFNNLYALHNTGQTGGISDCDIDAPETWNIETGSSDVIIAFMDSGIDYAHPDLASKIWSNVDEIPGNGIDDDNNGYIDDVRGWDFYYNDNDPLDENGHGTICAGIAAAMTNNGVGIAGVCWDCQIMPLKVNGLYNTEDIPSLWIDAIYYAVDNGADIISMSLGIGYYHPQLEVAVNYAYTNGVFLTASAGNQGWSDEHYPAAYSNVIGVAATNDEDKRMENAGQWSASSNYGPWVSVAAPGEDIFSTMPTYHVTFNDYGFNYDYMGGLCGTSCSAPLVAGLAALLLSNNPSYSPNDLRSIICGKVDPYNSSYDLGTGRINAYKTLTTSIINHNQQMYQDWNLITIPTENNLTASTLIQNISGCIMVSFFDAENQTYKSYVTGDPPPYDFKIKDGYGYFLYMNQQNIVDFSGYEVKSVSIPIHAGYNLIGWYQSYNTTASDLLFEIPGALIASVFDPVNQTYKSYATGDPPTYDFTITKGMGVFIWTDQPSTWYGTD